MGPSVPRVCSEPGGQKPVLLLSLDRIGGDVSYPTDSPTATRLGLCSGLDFSCLFRPGCVDQQSKAKDLFTDEFSLTSQIR